MTKISILLINKEEAKEIISGDYDERVYQIISDKVIAQKRWEIIHELIIKTLEDQKFWRTTYSVGATENQDLQPFDYQKEVPFEEVFSIVESITNYFTIEELGNRFREDKKK